MSRLCVLTFRSSPPSDHVVFACELLHLRSPKFDQSCRRSVPWDLVYLLCTYSVGEKEKLNLSPQFATQIAKSSNRNLRRLIPISFFCFFAKTRAILMLETCKVQHFPFKPNQPIPLPDWEVFVKQIAHQVSHSELTTP